MSKRATLNFALIFLIINITFGQENLNFIKLNRTFLPTSSIVEDDLGFITFTDTDGLYKFDGYGYNFISYINIFGEQHTNDREYLIAKDNNSSLWISSLKGELTKIKTDGSKVSYLDKLSYDRSRVQITSFKPKNKDIWLGSHNGVLYKHVFVTSKIDSITALPEVDEIPQKISSISFSDSNNLWLSTNIGKIYRFSLTTNRLTEINGPFSNIRQNIELTSDYSGNLWIATELKGLYKYDTKSNFKLYNKYKQINTSSKHPMFASIYRDKSGAIWAATDGGGLYKIIPETDKVVAFKEEATNKFSISSNTITRLSEDSKGNIWILGKKGEINILPKRDNKIKYFNGHKTNTPTKILSILKSSDGSLWLGTDGKGINRVFPNNTKVQYDFTKNGSLFFEGRYINQLLEDSKGNIWIATYLNGLWVYEAKSKQFIKKNTVNSSGFNSSEIRLLFKDSKNRIWSASTSGFNVYSENLESIATFDFNSNGLFGINSMGACEDEKGMIWFGVNPNMLYSFHEDLKNFNNSYFSKHSYFVKEKGDTRNYNIHSLYPDFNGKIWISTVTGKIIKYNISDNTFESFANENKLKDINIRSVILQDLNNLWFSSINGVHHYNTQTKLIKSFYQSDGLSISNFNRRSYFKDSKGVFYFGGEEGVNAFLPKDLIKKESSAKLYITNLEVLNKPVGLILQDQVNKRVEKIEELMLDYNQSSFSFQFAAIDNILNSNFHYAYKLNGFDEKWITPKKDRIATYTNIPHGNYTFEIRAGSKKGEWDLGSKKIEISINPPWWLSTLAIFLYIIFGALFIYSFKVWIQLKSKLEKEAWKNNQEKELYAIKMNFFAKMSHEIQTPLTLILGPISDMLERAELNGNRLLNQRLLMINNNANRLSRIATELMMIRNKEIGKLRIYATKNNLIKDFKRISLSFSELARFKKIDFIQEYPDEDISIWYDSDKIEHVIYNLLSNAFKFTPREGEVSLRIIHNNNNIEIHVTDSGPGIPKDELDDIFKLFYQSDLGKNNKGIGIGLALTKELVSLHKGEINVTSNEYDGTRFSVKLFTDDNLFSEDEKLIVEDSILISNSLEQEFKNLEKDLNFNNNKKQKEKQYTLLIVEDNIEMQMFLKDILSNNYNILIAENGKAGLNLAKKKLPDLIISDIMMPLMNGIELCKNLQSKKSTSHIPIILLTAKNTTSTKLKGLKSGAIEYINKPFNFHELLLKIHNILSSRENILSQYKTTLISSPDEIKSPSKDDIFLEKLIKELNSQVENPDFRLKDLSKTINMSYSVIYRRCQDITGKTLVEIVRSLKLKKAALLITKHGYNISESSYMVGYNDAKYFTKCFKEEFGLPPTSFIREAKLIGIEEIMKKYKIQV